MNFPRRCLWHAHAPGRCPTRRHRRRYSGWGRRRRCRGSGPGSRGRDSHGTSTTGPCRASSLPPRRIPARGSPPASGLRYRGLPGAVRVPVDLRQIPRCCPPPGAGRRDHAALPTPVRREPRPRHGPWRKPVPWQAGTGCCGHSAVQRREYALQISSSKPSLAASTSSRTREKPSSAP